LVIAAWNLFLPEENGQSKTVTIVLRGLAGRRWITLYRLDATHGSLMGTYDKLGKPQYPTQAQIAQLRRASEIPPPETILLENGKITISIPPQGLALLEIR
jgi:xylan 1,4-beta-xylosidase